MRRYMRSSTIAVLGVFLLIGAIGGITLFASNLIGRTVLEQFQSQQLQTATSTSQQTQAYFGSLNNEVVRLTQVDSIRAVARSSTENALIEIETSLAANERESVVKSVTRFNLRGVPLYAWPESNNELIVGDYPYLIPEDLVAQTRDGGIVDLETNIYRVSLHGQPDQFAYLMIVPFTNIIDNTEYLVYELNMSAVFNTVLEFALEDVRESESGQLWVFDHDGEVVFAARPEPDASSAHRIITPSFLGNFTEPRNETYSIDGIDREAALAPVDLFNRQFIMMLSRDTSEARDIVASDLRLIFVVAVASVALVGILTMVALRRIFREVSRRQSETSMRRATRSLLEVSRALNSSLDLQFVLSQILVELQTLIPYYSASVLLLNEYGELEVAAHRGPDIETHRQGIFKAEETRAARQVIALNQPVIIEDTSQDPRWTPMPNSNVHSWIGLPLRVQEQSVGVLNINNDVPSSLSTDQLELAEAFSDQASVAIQNARLHEREVNRIAQELALARSIQASLLPSVAPQVPQLEIAFRSLPAREVSGDFFQLIPLPDGQLGIFVGDVTGKGMPAALIMAVVTTALRDEVIRERQPGQLLNKLNIRLLDRLLQNQMHSALLSGIFDPKTGEFAVANAGMVQPYWRLKETPWDFVDVGGYPLGASQHTNYSSKTLAFPTGSMMVLFSDGIIEAQNSRGEFFGFERFEILLDSIPPETTSEEVIDRILKAVQQHLGSEDAQDDITVMVIKSLMGEPNQVALVDNTPPHEQNGKEAHWFALDHPVPYEEYIMPRENVELFLPSILGFEKVARSAAEAIARNMGFSEERIDDLKTAVAEACMNAIEHGNLEDKSTSVTVLLSTSADHLEIRVVDRGRQRIPNPLPPPGDPENARGWGMFFIQNLMDEVEFLETAEGNIVRMTLFLGRDETREPEPSSDASEWLDQVE